MIVQGAPNPRNEGSFESIVNTSEYVGGCTKPTCGGSHSYKYVWSEAILEEREGPQA